MRLGILATEHRNFYQLSVFKPLFLPNPLLGLPRNLLQGWVGGDTCRWGRGWLEPVCVHGACVIWKNIFRHVAHLLIMYFLFEHMRRLETAFQAAV